MLKTDFPQVPRPFGKLIRQGVHVDPVPLLERRFSDPVLFNVVITTEADDPAIGRLEAHASVGVTAHMRALDRPGETARHAAVMFAHPGTVGGALAAARLARPLALKPVR